MQIRMTGVVSGHRHEICREEYPLRCQATAGHHPKTLNVLAWRTRRKIPPTEHDTLSSHCTHALISRAVSQESDSFEAFRDLNPE